MPSRRSCTFTDLRSNTPWPASSLALCGRSPASTAVPRALPCGPGLGGRCNVRPVRDKELKTVTNINFFDDNSTSAFPDITKRAYFMGFVRYRDIFGEHYVMGFCFVLDLKENRWVLMGGKEHNYCKEDQAFENPAWMHPSSNPSSIRSAINRAALDTQSKDDAR